MNRHFLDYYWKMGKPYGKEIVEASAPHSYKIVSDPYGKRYSIEKYSQGCFEGIVYDSALLDFRKLQPAEQAAWEKEPLEAEEGCERFLLRNQEDRAILIETHYFEQNRCRSCVVHSVHGVLLSTHRLTYKVLNDSFDGVTLYDSEDRPVMSKRYETDPQTGEFTTMLQEEWVMQGAAADGASTV